MHILQGREREMEEEKRQRSMTRRAFVAGLGIAAGLLLWRPRVALADEPWWDGGLIFRGNGSYYGSKLWGDIGSLEAGAGGAAGGTMYTDRWVCAKTPWVEWDISARQFIRTASKITMRCDFSTELYHHITGRLEIACGSYNEHNASYNLWHPDSGDDTRYTLLHRVNGRPEAGFVEGEHVVVIDNETGDGLHRDGAQIWTDYRSYPGSDYSVWIRREASAMLHSFQLKSSFWNYYYYGTDWYYNRQGDPPINYTTRWVDQYADRITISSNLAWANRVLTITPAACPSMRFCVPRAQAASGVQCAIDANGNLTSQHWIAEANTSDPVKGTLRFIPAHLGDGSFSLDQTDGGPRMQPSAAQLWSTVRDSRNQSMWAHDDGANQWLFADCSGMALDRLSAGTAAGTLVQFHSNGYPAGEWTNESHKWRLADARFGTADGKPLDLQIVGGPIAPAPGTTFSVSSWDAKLSPNAKLPGGLLADSGIVYEYDWIISDDTGVWLTEAPEVFGSARLVGGDWLSEQPAAGLVGVIGLDKKLDGLKFSIRETSLSGRLAMTWSGVGGYETLSFRLNGDIADHYSVKYRVHVDGAGWSQWAKDGVQAGTVGQKISGVCVRIRHKDAVIEGSSGNTFCLAERHKGKYLACIVRARTKYNSIPYCGSAASNPVYVPNDGVRISYYVDGEQTPCWQEEGRESEPYATSAEAKAAGKKPQCSKFECWFTDAACTKPYEENASLPKGSLSLYGRNMARITYAFTDSTGELFSRWPLFTDERASQPTEASSFLPADRFVAWSTRLRAAKRKSVWYEAHGAVREATAVAGLYLSADESRQPATLVRITADTTLYLAWSPARYEGIEVS